MAHNLVYADLERKSSIGELISCDTRTALTKRRRAKIFFAKRNSESSLDSAILQNEMILSKQQYVDNVNWKNKFIDLERKRAQGLSQVEETLDLLKIISKRSEHLAKSKYTKIANIIHRNGIYFGICCKG